MSQVVCLHPDGTFLRQGQTYTVKERLGDLIGLTLFCGMLWGSWRFSPKEGG